MNYSPNALKIYPKLEYISAKEDFKSKSSKLFRRNYIRSRGDFVFFLSLGQDNLFFGDLVFRRLYERLCISIDCVVFNEISLFYLLVNDNGFNVRLKNYD